MRCFFCCFFFFFFFEFISVNSLKMANIGELPYGVLWTAPKIGSAKKLNLSLYGGVRTSCKEKRAGRAKFAVFSFTY